jgi:hypothetical protein
VVDRNQHENQQIGVMVDLRGSKIIIASKGGVELTFRCKDDDLYYVRVKRTKAET